MKEIIRVFLISIVSSFICLVSTLIILPSTKSHDAFNDSFLRIKKNIKLNLIFDDEAINTAPHDRKFISYIGTITNDHAFNEFVNLVFKVCDGNLLLGINFLICSKSSIPKDCVQKIEKCVHVGRLKVIAGKPLKIHEINDYYAMSLIVWNAYKRSMQSGVLPKAYMFGAPIITTLSCSPEYFVNESTGLVISPEYELEDFIDKVSSILASFPKYSSGARAFFYKNFYYKSQSEQFINGLNS